MPRSRIGANDLRSRDLHAEWDAELHLSKNRRPAESAPYFARLARFSSNWRRPSPKNLKSSCSSRHRQPKLGMAVPENHVVRPPGFEFPDHRTDGLPGRWVGSPLDAPCYVLDQARLRPHEPPRLALGSSILRF